MTPPSRRTCSSPFGSSTQDLRLPDPLPCFPTSPSPSSPQLVIRDLAGNAPVLLPHPYQPPRQDADLTLFCLVGLSGEVAAVERARELGVDDTPPKFPDTKAAPTTPDPRPRRPPLPHHLAPGNTRSAAQVGRLQDVLHVVVTLRLGYDLSENACTAAASNCSGEGSEVIVIYYATSDASQYEVHIIVENVVSSSAVSDDWVWRFVFRKMEEEADEASVLSIN